MVDAPEKVWVYEPIMHEIGSAVFTQDHGYTSMIEYTRSDLVAELAAENERLKQRLADHPRATNTVEDHGMANLRDKPEGQQEPVAWLCIRGDNIGLCFPSDEGAFPVYRTRPSEQAVTEAGIEAAERTMDAHYERPLKAWELTALHEALKAAMEAGHD